MSARHCVTDGINYPSDMRFMTCPLCGGVTEFRMDYGVSPDYAERIAAHLEHAAGSLLEAPELPVVEGKVFIRDDQYWIHSWDVYASLKYRLQPDALIQVGKQTFEVLHYLDEERLYLIKPFSLELTDEDLANLAGP